MSKNKIFSIIILGLLLTINASATPGVDDHGRATTNLEYDPDNHIDITINTTGLPTGEHFILYPIYQSDTIIWRQLKTGGGTPVKITVDGDNTETINDIILNVSGLWALSTSGSYNGSTPTPFFWVNGTNVFNINLSLEDTTFGDNDSITITVTDDNGSAECWIDVFREDGIQILHEYRSDGIIDSSDWLPDDLQWAGNYTVQAYRDIDDQHVHPYESYYNSEYTGSKTYNFSNIGAFDPPEHTSTQKRIVVHTGTPETSMDVTEVFWSFDGEINISTEEQNLSVLVFNNDNDNITNNIDITYIDESILIKNKDPTNITTGGWGRDSSGNIYGNNGTWTIFLSKDIDSDNIEEWNTTLEFKVLSAEPVQWFWIDDDGVTSDNNHDSEIPHIPDITEMPLLIQFQIISNDHTFYGSQSSNPIEDYGQNITLSGDALYLSSKKLNDFPGVTYLNGTWTVPLTPIMSTGERKVTFNINWNNYGSFTQDLRIGGTDYNGTIVKISPSIFTIDTETTISVQVFGPLGDNYPISNAGVSLYWLNTDGTLGDMLNETTQPDVIGVNTYSFTVNKTEQNNNLIELPRKLIGYVSVTNIGFGYAMTSMQPKSDLIVSLSKDTVMAGERTESTLSIRVGNTTEPDDNDMKVEFYNSEGEKVSLDSSFGTIRNSDIIDRTTIYIYDAFIKPGTYTIYAYNKTHDSTGNNATLTVQPVEVSCNLDEFIWKFDTSINATFYVTYNGNYINGTLEVQNISDEGNSYRTWTPTSHINLQVVNGVVQIENINVSELPLNKFQENISFLFKPDTSGSKYAPTNGQTPIKVAHVTATPSILVFNEPSSVEVRVTGRNIGLNNVLVGLNIPGHTETAESTTDSSGRVTFAFTTLTSGTITIQIENRTSDVSILITSWSLHLSAPLQSNEDEPFTITVRNSSSTGEIITDALITFAGQTNTEQTLTAPSVRNDIYYTITVSKIGHKETSTNILILNVPKLEIYIDELTFIYVPNSENTFTIIIADDEGKPIVGATVLFNNKTYTSGVSGVVTLEIPSEAGNYTIEAIKDGFETSTALSISSSVKQSTPGFEILSLIVALGVCFILIRKRKRK